MRTQTRLTQKDLTCPNEGCGDDFEYPSELKRHAKKCVYAPKVSAAETEPPTPTPDKETPVESSTMQKTQETIVPASPETMKKLEIGEAVTRAVPNADPNKVAQALAYAAKRKEALMKSEDKKKNQTPKQQAVTELSNIITSIQNKVSQLGNWPSKALLENLAKAEDFVAAAVANVEEIPDTDALKYKDLIREIEVGDKVVVRTAQLERYPASKKTMLGTDGGEVKESEGEGKGRFLLVQFDGFSLSIPFVHLKLKSR